jgi:hypothetical protein
LPHGLAHHGVAASLAETVDHLFVGQHRTQGGTPVHRHLGHVGQALVVQLQEDPLRPAVVLGVGRAELAVPVVRQAQPLQLLFEPLDVTSGLAGRMLAGLERMLLGGQTKRVPSHGVQDVEPVHPLEARHDVGRGVALGMADVEPRPRWIGEHVERVELGLVAVVLGPERLVLEPVLLPARLHLGEVVARAGQVDTRLLRFRAGGTVGHDAFLRGTGWLHPQLRASESSGLWYPRRTPVQGAARDLVGSRACFTQPHRGAIHAHDHLARSLHVRDRR